MTEAQKEAQISELISQSPLAFMAYIDDYDKGGFNILIPNEACTPLLMNNVCLFGKWSR